MIKIFSVLIVFLNVFSLGSAVLIDNFEDLDLSPHVIKTGTELDNMTRTFIGGEWKNTDQQLYFKDPSKNMRSIQYEFSSQYDINMFSKMVFTFQNDLIEKARPISCDISFNFPPNPMDLKYNLTRSTNYWDNIKITSGQIIDLEEISRNFVDSSSEDVPDFHGIDFDSMLGFDPTQRKLIGFTITFNEFLEDDKNIESIYLSRIETVPEPISLITLGTGLIMRMRKRNIINNRSKRKIIKGFEII